MRTKSVYLILLRSLYLAAAILGVESLSVTTQVTARLNQQTGQEKILTEKLQSQTAETSNNTLAVTKTNQKHIEKLSPGKVWVVDKEKEVQADVFTWVVNDTKK
ncbi:MAG: peptidase M43, partial [Cyanobacteria bacterium J06632_19]